jgi:predicted helicase
MQHSFNTVLTKYRQISFSEKDKGERFERLMKAYLLTDTKYATKFKKVWLWAEFPGKDDLGGNDTGIDLVALTNEGDYWAIQCKCYQEGSVIDKPAIDSFLATSSRAFFVEGRSTLFSYRLWIDTTGQAFGVNAEKAITHQNPPVGRYRLTTPPKGTPPKEGNLTKEDIFYYVYGFLHSPTYRELFANDLKKMLPRLPLLEEVKDFWAFSQAGRKLAELHLNYETVAPFADATVTGDKFPSDAATITGDTFPSFGGVPEVLG